MEQIEVCTKCSSDELTVIHNPDHSCVDTLEDATRISVEGCTDYVEKPLEDVYVEDTGRLIRVSIRLKNICRGKRVSVGVLLHEVDGSGKLHPRGFRTFIVPKGTHTYCEDYTIHCIYFVVPDGLTDMQHTGRCDKRTFELRVIAHYLDTDVPTEILE